MVNNRYAMNTFKTVFEKNVKTTVNILMEYPYFLLVKNLCKNYEIMNRQIRIYRGNGEYVWILN